TVWVFGPASFLTSSLLPVATMRPSWMASACTTDDLASSVTTLPLMRIVSAVCACAAVAPATTSAATRRFNISIHSPYFDQRLARPKSADKAGQLLHRVPGAVQREALHRRRSEAPDLQRIAARCVAPGERLPSHRPCHIALPRRH